MSAQGLNMAEVFHHGGCLSALLAVSNTVVQELREHVTVLQVVATLVLFEEALVLKNGNQSSFKLQIKIGKYFF